MTTEPTTITNDLDAAIDAFASAMRRDAQHGPNAAAFEAACRLFAGWLQEHGQVPAMDQIAASHVEDWEAHLRATMPHETFHDNHRGVQQFLTWYGRQRDPDWRTRSAWRRAPVASPSS
jgi:hypothetical protein